MENVEEPYGLNLLNLVPPKLFWGFTGLLNKVETPPGGVGGSPKLGDLRRKSPKLGDLRK